MERYTATVLHYLLILTFLIRFSVSDNEYYVIGERGATCPSNNHPCNRLSFYINQFSLYFTTDNTVFYFLKGTHLLNSQELVVIRGVTNVTLQGLGGQMLPGFHETVRESTVHIKCTNTSYSGLIFEDSDDITISGITFSECGGLLGDTSGLISTQVNMTLGFTSVNNVTLERVSVLNGTGIGLLIRNTFDITIRECSFSQNVIPTVVCLDLLCTGGNLHIIYFDAEDTIESNITDINIDIIHSNFSLGFSTEFGISGGIDIAISLTQTFVNLNVVLDELVIFGNTAILAPNLNIGLTCLAGITYDITINNTVSMYGNAIKLPPQSLLDILQINSGGFQFLDQSTGHTPSQIVIANSEFSNGNVYNYGGILLSILSQVSDEVLTVYMENCVFRNNTGDVGSAMYVFISRTLENNLPLFIMKNTIIERNHLNVGNDALFGAVLLQNVNATLSQVRIASNTATGLVSLASVITFIGTENVFVNNSGINGGGMALYESSFIVFQPPAYVSFINNWAASKGGGIFVGQIMITSDIKASCFYQLKSDGVDYIGRVQVLFSGNKANQSGSALYGGNVENCQSSITRFSRVFNYTLQTGQSVISSDPIEICYCTNGVQDCLTYRYPVSVYPGQIFSIPVAAVGQMRGITGGVLQLTDYTMSTTPTTTFESLTSRCNMVNYVTQLVSDQQTSLEIYLTLAGSINPRTDSRNKLLYVTVLPCPPGFSFDRRLGWCQCEALILRVRGVECNVTTEEMTRSGNVWMGYNNASNCTYIREDCPFSYCFPHEVTFDILDPSPQCALNRSGIMCGGCAEGYSLMLGSDQCGECSHVYILLIVVFALAGVGLVALIIALNLTVSLGTVNGLIFYANIIKINEELLFPYGQLPVLSQFVSWINLDFGIQSCFFDGMTALDKAWLQFVFPVYIWIIIIVLIILAQYSTKVSKLLGNSAVPVLCTLMILAYAKIFRASITAFNGTILTCGRNKITVWYIDPNIDYYHPSHIILVIVAAVFLFLFALPFTLVVLFNYPLGLGLNSEKCHKFGCHSQKLGLRLFFEAFNSPYKPEFTFWTGLLLLIRFIIVFVVAFSSNTYHTLSTAILITFLLSFQASFSGVYKSKALNILETSFLLNLGVTVIFAIIGNNKITVVTTGVSVAIALVTFIVIFSYHLFLRLKEVKYLQPIWKKMENYIVQRKESMKPLGINNDAFDVGRERTVSSTSIELRRRETLLTSDDEDIKVRSYRVSEAIISNRETY